MDLQTGDFERRVCDGRAAIAKDMVKNLQKTANKRVRCKGRVVMIKQ